MWANYKVVRIHAGHNLTQHVRCLGTQWIVSIQRLGQLEAHTENSLKKRRLNLALTPRKVLAEEFEVPAEVEDKEVLFVLAGAEQPRAQPRTAANHLPELRTGMHRLEEHKVHYLRNIDPGVQHVHTDSDVRGLLALAEVIYEALGRSAIGA